MFDSIYVISIIITIVACVVLTIVINEISCRRIRKMVDKEIQLLLKKWPETKSEKKGV